MSDVLIVSKTRAPTGYCVGAIELNTRRSLRLKTANGDFQPWHACPFSIGEIHDIRFTIPTNLAPPHIETVYVQANALRQTISHQQIAQYVLANLSVWRGNPSALFNGMLAYYFRNNSGYIGPNAVPSLSLGYWISDVDLIANTTAYNGRASTRYDLNGATTGIRSFKFVGDVQPIINIPAGTLMRVSLGQWWNGWWQPHYPEPQGYRCYLQLSGWYI